MDKDHPSWFNPRKYLHFDQPIGFKKAERIASSPRKVASHSFYPFITYELISTKIGKNSEGEIEKKNKERGVAYAGHADSHIYSFYADILSSRYEKKVEETGLNDVVLAFRKSGKNNIDFAYNAFKKIDSLSPCSVLAYDISGFFDNLEHSHLKEMWCKALDEDHLPEDHYSVFRSITKYSKVDRFSLYKALGVSLNNPKADGRKRVCTPEEFRRVVRGGGLVEVNKTGKGIPQGASISALLSNIYMFDFDVAVASALEEIGGVYFRYCDDMLMIVPHEWKSGVGNFVVPEIRRIGLSINVAKTEEHDFYHDRSGRLRTARPLQYLGFLYDGDKILLRSAGLARFSEKMKRGVSLAKKTQRKANRARARQGLPAKKLYRRKIYSRYSYLGKRNFVTYGHRAAEKMGSMAIKKQLKPLWKRLLNELGDE